MNDFRWLKKSQDREDTVTNILHNISYATQHIRTLFFIVVIISSSVFFVPCPVLTEEQTTAEVIRRPNELGKIMVLMYHEVGPNESTWRRTPENLLKDLKKLYEDGYRPISLRDFVNGNITTPKGFTPVVLTFDDGTAGQFRFVENKNGEKSPDPKSAVGILMDFHDQHPDFPAEATFFLHGTRPFEEKKTVTDKLRFLIANGMDIGNHTAAHQNLGDRKYQNPAIIQRIVGSQAKFLTEQIAGDFPEYSIDTLALCYGRRPKKSWLSRYLHKGRFENFEYRNIAVLNVGAGPAHSPFDERFRPLSLPRIRASEKNTYGVGLYSWLKYFDMHPDERFVSDGDVKTVTLPKTVAHLNIDVITALGFGVVNAD